MFALRTKTPGAATAPKAEMMSASAAYTNLRLYLCPVRIRAFTIFDTYDFDFQITTTPPTDGIDVVCGIYRRVAGLSATTSAVLVSGTSATGSAVFPATALSTVALGSTKTLEPGDYFIGFMFDYTGPAAPVTCLNSHANQSWVTGDWVYADQASLTLPSSVGSLSSYYIHAANENPFFSSIYYSGDVIP